MVVPSSAVVVPSSAVVVPSSAVVVPSSVLVAPYSVAAHRSAFFNPKSDVRNPKFQRGMLLVVVLVIISVLGVLAASFAYRVNADLASVKAAQDQQQALMAARTGIEVVIELLREGRTDMTNWYNNYLRFRRIPVYLPGERDSEEGKGGSQSIADQDKIEGRPVWRFSIVGYERSDKQTDRAKIRYGITDEASKVNLSIASRSQLLALFDSIKHEGVTSEELADALIDWRDKDDDESPSGAESRYYLKMKPAYRAKNAPLSSIEELLMIKGFNGRILYGEDYNRNGYLDDNEDDGEEEGAFPPDDGDGQLDQGLLPYVTVYSWDWNRSNDNKMRVDINTIRFNKIASGGENEGDGAGGAGRAGAGAPGGIGAGLAAFAQRVPAHIAEELRPEVIDFINKAQQRNYRFKSVGDLLGLEVYQDGSSNHDAMWRRYAREFRRAEARVAQENQEQNAGQNEDEESDEENDGSGDDLNVVPGGNNQGRDENERGGRGGERNDNENDRDAGRRDNQNNRGDSADEGEDEENKETGRRRQSIRNNAPAPGPGNDGGDNNAPRGGRRGGRNEGSGQAGNRNANADEQPGGGDESAEGDRPGRGRRGPRGEGRGGPGGNDRGEGRRGNRGQGGLEAPGGAQGPGGQGRGTPEVSPVEASDLPVLMDRLSVWNSPVMAGLINVNTAPAAVLRTIPGLEEADVEAILDKRLQVQPADKLTPAWLVTSGALEPEKFALISNLVTTRSIQFTIDSIGFADHVGSVKRIQAVIEMRGELAQLKYYRDITSLGVGFPVWDDQRSEGFAFSDR